MVDLRPVLFVLGLLLSIMIVPAAVDAAVGHHDWQVFAASCAVTLFVGVSLILASRTGWSRFTIRQAFVMTTFAWLTIAVFGALPFAFSELDLSYTDAFFESMSGITTTGSTVIVGLDHAPPGILLWRAALQWLGGIGIIVMAIAILPILPMHRHPLACLHPPEHGINAVHFHQLFVPALLLQLPVFQDKDTVGVTHCREAVGYDDSGPVDGNALQRALDGRFCLVVDGRRCLVQHEYGRIFEHGAGDRNALSLSAG